MTPQKPWWQHAGVMLAFFVVVAGLATLAFMIIAVLAMGSFGSNK